MSALKEHYRNHVKKQLTEKFEYANPMQVPGLRKVSLNMGIRDALKDKNAVQDCVNELTTIAGQKAVLTNARKSISNFKLREGTPVGVKVTLRGKRMWDFVTRFFNITCPRIRDFRGFVAKGDGRGNVSIGLSEQQPFIELDLDKVKRTQGMHITFVTDAETDEEAIELLRLLGFPFKELPIEVI